MVNNKATIQLELSPETKDNINAQHINKLAKDIQMLSKKEHLLITVIKQIPKKKPT
jgi:hypothetical protein